jgi:Protein of unknown function (DUF1488)
LPRTRTLQNLIDFFGPAALPHTTSYQNGSLEYLILNHITKWKSRPARAGEISTALLLEPIADPYCFHGVVSTDIDLPTWHNEIPPEWSIAMPLQRGEVQGYDFNRMIVEFTMLNQGKVVPCAISTTAMDDLEGSRDVRPDQRVDQFIRLREVIEERASRKFFEEQAQADRPVVLRSNDFH